MYLMSVMFTSGVKKVILAHTLTQLRHWRKLNKPVIADYRTCDEEGLWVDSHNLTSWQRFDINPPKTVDIILYKRAV